MDGELRSSFRSICSICMRTTYNNDQSERNRAEVWSNVAAYWYAHSDFYG